MNFYRVVFNNGEKQIITADGFSLKNENNYHCFVFYADDKLVAAFTATKISNIILLTEGIKK